MSGDQCQITGGVMVHACAEKDKLSPPRQLNGGCIEGTAPDSNLIDLHLPVTAHSHGPASAKRDTRRGSRVVGPSIKLIYGMIEHVCRRRWYRAFAVATTRIYESIRTLATFLSPSIHFRQSTSTMSRQSISA